MKPAKSGETRVHLQRALKRATSWRAAQLAEAGAPLPDDLAATIESTLFSRRHSEEVVVVAPAGSFASYLLMQPRAVAGSEVTFVGNPSKMLSPLQATGRLLGIPLTLARLEGHYARRAHLDGMLRDDECGVDKLSADAREVAGAMARDDENFDDRLAVAASTLTSLMQRRAIAFGRGEDGCVRRLDPPGAPPDVVLDIALGRFTPDQSIMIGSDAWTRAHATCRAIGDVFFDGGALASETIAGSATAASEKRARRELIQSFRVWRASGGELRDAPRRSAWLNGDGPLVSGSVAAAKRAWAAAVASSSDFAALRRAGRRPKSSMK